MCLCPDDVERVLDVADEFGIDIDENEVQDLWDKYTQTKGDESLGLPFSSEELADILIEVRTK